MSMNEPSNVYSLSDGTNTVNIFTEIEEVIVMSERAARAIRAGGAILRIDRPHDDAMDRPRREEEGR